MVITYETEAIRIPVGPVTLEGDLAVPKKMSGFVVFAHGSGSSRFSTRNRFVAEKFYDDGIGSLLFDLLTEKEDRNYENRFRIESLTKRLVAAVKWVAARPEISGQGIGLFGASTGAAAALQAAGIMGSQVNAVVSRGGRPDLAGSLLMQVQAPTLLIVGGQDDPVIELNEDAFSWLSCIKRLVIVPGATHLFEEAGKLEEVARLASEWFRTYLKAQQPVRHNRKKPVTTA